MRHYTLLNMYGQHISLPRLNRLEETILSKTSVINHKTSPTRRLPKDLNVIFQGKKKLKYLTENIYIIVAFGKC